MTALKTRAQSIVNKLFPDVTKVVDARRGIAIRVEPEDIKGSTKKKHEACALARACKRTMRLDGAIISRSRAYLIRGRIATRYILPPSVEREIVSFDRGVGFAPGEYELAGIDREHKQGRKINGGGKHTGTRPKPRHLTTGVRAVLHA